MDATTNIQDSFLREDFLVGRDMGLLGVEDSYLDVFNLDAFGSNNNGLSHEPETTPFTQTWEGIHMEQSVSMLPYMGEDEYIWPDIMTSSDDTSQFDPSPSLLPSEYFESTNYYLSPSLPRQETELQLLNAPVNTIEQLTVDWKLSPNLPTTCRRILPRPLEQTCIGSENGHHCQVEKAKKRPYDSSRRKRRKATDQHQCRLCGKMTPSKKSLDRHHVVSHKNYAASRGLDTGPFLCSSPGCKKTYTRKDNLTRHFNKKHERKCR